MATGSLEGRWERGVGAGMKVKKQVLKQHIGNPGFSFAVPDLPSSIG